jgi:ATP-dependent RNA helicase DDX3X
MTEIFQATTMSATQQLPSGNKAFDTADMSNALADTTDAHNKESNTQAGDSAARAREQGWAEPEKYNYSAYNASGREATDSTLELTDWASNAAKYEWKDEFGDIGPPHPELERQLFHEGTGTHSGILFQK